MRKSATPVASKRGPRQKGSGTVIERGPRRWLIRYGGCTPPINETVHGTKVEAEDELRSLIAQAKKGGVALGSRLTFNELADMFVAAKRISREATTANLYERDLRNHIRPVIGKLKARAVTAQHITNLLENARNCSRYKSTKGQPLDPDFKGSLMTLVSAVLKFGVRQDLLVRNVCEMVARPAKAYKDRAPVTADDGFLVALLAAARDTDLEALILAAIGTGARRGELCGLRTTDVDFETGAYSIRRAVKNLGTAVVVGKVKTAKSARSDVMPAFVLESVRAHRLRQRERHLALGVRVEDPYLFDDGTGGPMNPNSVSRRFMEFIRAKGLKPCRFHDLRHLNASLSYAAGVPLKVISEGLGHSNIGITSTIYTHLLNGAMAAKSAALDGYVGDALRKSAGKRH
jgi:integrase